MSMKLPLEWKVDDTGVIRCDEIDATIFMDHQERKACWLFQIYIPCNGVVVGRTVSLESAKNRVLKTIEHCAELERKINAKQ